MITETPRTHPTEHFYALSLDDEGWWTASAQYSPRHGIQSGVGKTPGRAIEMVEKRLSQQGNHP